MERDSHWCNIQCAEDIGDAKGGQPDVPGVSAFIIHVFIQFYTFRGISANQKKKAGAGVKLNPIARPGDNNSYIL